MAGPFVNPEKSATRDVAVSCPCEGSPHVTDTVTIRTEFTGAELSRINSAVFTYEINEGPRPDTAKRDAIAMEIAVRGWSFVDASGNAIPFDPMMIPMLRSDIWDTVSGEVDKELSKNPLATRMQVGGAQPIELTSTLDSSTSAPVLKPSPLFSSTPSQD